MPWCLHILYEYIGPRLITIDRQKFSAGQAEIFLWEAFVTGKDKAGSHANDAIAAVNAFPSNIIKAASVLTDEPALNLAVAAALATKHNIDVGEITSPSFVVSPSVD